MDWLDFINRYEIAAESLRGINRFDHTVIALIGPGTTLERRLSIALIPICATAGLCIIVSFWNNVLR